MYPIKETIRRAKLRAKYRKTIEDQIQYDRDPELYERSYQYFYVHYTSMLTRPQYQLEQPSVDKTKAYCWQIRACPK